MRTTYKEMTVTISIVRRKEWKIFLFKFIENAFKKNLEKPWGLKILLKHSKE